MRLNLIGLRSGLLKFRNQISHTLVLTHPPCKVPVTSFHTVMVPRTRHVFHRGIVPAPPGMRSNTVLRLLAGYIVVRYLFRCVGARVWSCVLHIRHDDVCVLALPDE